MKKIPITIKVDNELLSFDTLKDAAKYFNVNYQKVHLRITRYGWSVKDALTKDRIVINNKVFNNLEEACRYYKIKKHNYWYRKRMGWTIEECFGIVHKNPIECKGLLYIIKNKINCKVYIGMTTTPLDIRFKAHVRAAVNNRSNSKLAKAIRKYGSENFYIKLLKTTSNRKLLCSLEKDYIEKYNSINKGYNQMAGGSTLAGKSGHPIEYKGVVYKDTKTLVEKYNIPYYLIRYRLKKNISLEKPLRRPKSIMYLNKKYSSLSELALYLNLDTRTVQKRIENKLYVKSGNKIKMHKDEGIARYVV